MADIKVPERASQTLIIVGYVLAVLLSVIGLALGAFLWLGKVPNASGKKVLRYDEYSRKHGKYIFILGFISLLTFLIIRSM